MGKEFDLRLTQISASTDTKLGGPSSVVINTHGLLSQKLGSYKLLVFGESRISGPRVFKTKTILNNRFGFFCNIFSPSLIHNLRNSEVLLIHGYYLFSTLYSIAIFRGKKIFLMPHGTFEKYQKARHTIRKSIFSILLRCFLKNRQIHFITASHSEVESLRDSFPHNEITVVGLGVEIPPDALIEEHRNEEIRLIFVGRVVVKKRVDLCLQAVKFLRTNGHNVSLRIIGAGSSALREDLLNLVEELDLSAHVKFLGHMEKDAISVELSKADVFLLPSENENFAIAVAESIAALVPVIVSNQVSMHTFVDKHKVGVTISELNSNLLGQAVLQIIKDYDEFRENCKNCRNLLSWNEVFNTWMDVIALKVDRGIL